MKITKRYMPKEIIFHLLPDQMEKIKSSLKEYARSKNDTIGILIDSFSINTVSQTAETSDAVEFRELIRKLSPPILTLEAAVNMDIGIMDTNLQPVFNLNYRQDAIEI